MQACIALEEKASFTGVARCPSPRLCVRLLLPPLTHWSQRERERRRGAAATERPALQRHAVVGPPTPPLPTSLGAKCRTTPHAQPHPPIPSLPSRILFICKGNEIRRINQSTGVTGLSWFQRLSAARPMCSSVLWLTALSSSLLNCLMASGVETAPKLTLQSNVLHQRLVTLTKKSNNS